MCVHGYVFVCDMVTLSTDYKCLFLRRSFEQVLEFRFEAEHNQKPLCTNFFFFFFPSRFLQKRSERRKFYSGEMHNLEAVCMYKKTDSVAAL